MFDLTVEDRAVPQSPLGRLAFPYSVWDWAVTGDPPTSASSTWRLLPECFPETSSS